MDGGWGGLGKTSLPARIAAGLGSGCRGFVEVCVLWQELPKTTIFNVYGPIFVAVIWLPSTLFSFSANLQAFQMKGAQVFPGSLQSALMSVVSIGLNCYHCATAFVFLQRNACLVIHFHDISTARPTKIGHEPLTEHLLLNCGSKLALQIRKNAHPLFWQGGFTWFFPAQYFHIILTLFYTPPKTTFWQYFYNNNCFTEIHGSLGSPES